LKFSRLFLKNPFIDVPKYTSSYKLKPYNGPKIIPTPDVMHQIHTGPGYYYSYLPFSMIEKIHFKIFHL